MLVSLPEVFPARRSTFRSGAGHRRRCVRLPRMYGRALPLRDAQGAVGEDGLYAHGRALHRQRKRHAASAGVVQSVALTRNRYRVRALRFTNKKLAARVACTFFQTSSDTNRRDPPRHDVAANSTVSALYVQMTSSEWAVSPPEHQKIIRSHNRVNVLRSC